MRSRKQGRLKNMCAFIVLVCFVLVSILSLVFVVVHQHHDCHGDGCEICLQLTVIKQTFRQQLPKAGSFTGAFFLFVFMGMALLRRIFADCQRSLFSQKVKLNI